MRKTLSLFFVFLILSPLVLAVDRVEINTASSDQLDQLTGVGPVIAQRIIEARPFSSVDDLIRVKGIGEKTLQKIKDQGLAYVSGENQEIDNNQQSNIIENSIVAPPPDSNPLQDSQSSFQITNYPEGIFINEILPSPKGADETDEWIELYNSNNFIVNLSSWKLKDEEGVATTYILPQNAEISALGYLVLKRPDTKILLNNDGDSLNLIQPDGKIINSVAYEKALSNQSYSKFESGWQWNENLTPGSKNIITKNNLNKGSLAKVEKTEDKKVLQAALNQTANLLEENSNQENRASPWFLFSISLAVIIISGGIILFIKFKKP